ncbi:cupin domain-containing protein [Williamsia sp.]|uniref:cupin domain-containing protein n=1 Tax=Williamsia sp. TaxID=1872085 RepID=UPI002F929A17
MTDVPAEEPTEPAEFTVITGLDEVIDSGTERPKIDVVARVAGANVVHLSLRAGQVMADHRSAMPILVIGQRGLIEFSVGGERVELSPGTAVNVAAGVTHKLVAVEDSAATLLVLKDAR